MEFMNLNFGNVFVSLAPLRIVQIFLGVSFLALFFLSIATFAMKKPLRLWGIFLLLVGVELFAFYPEQRIPASGMIVLSLLYFMKGWGIFAYRRKNFLNRRKKCTDLSARKIFGDILALLGGIYFVRTLLPFRNYGEDLSEIVAYTAYVILLIFYAWSLLHIVIFDILAPLIIVKEELRSARLKDALFIERYIGKGLTVGEPYLFFEREESYVSYRRYTEEIREIAGHLCEYTVQTDLFGNEIIKECPIAISEDREFTELVLSEDLKDRRWDCLIGRRLHEADDDEKTILPILLGFIFPVLLISVTMLLLHLFL